MHFADIVYMQFGFARLQVSYAFLCTAQHVQDSEMPPQSTYIFLKVTQMHHGNRNQGCQQHCMCSTTDA